MQVNSSSTVDPVIANAALQNQIDVAIVGKVRQVEKQQGDAVVALIQDAVQVSDQIASGHIDVKL